MPNPTHDKHVTVGTLITDGLGYCCPWVFFRRFRSTAMIALRLGVSTGTVRTWKRAFKAGEFTCTCRENCMKEKLK
jgi:hypothetical protein